MKFFLVFSLTLSVCAGDFPSKDYSFVRIFEKAAENPDWDKMTIRQQMIAVRALALKQKTVSDPVSDRYTITAYGGPVDLVHFLMLAAEAQKDKIDMRERLYKEWVQEGGPKHQHGYNPSYPTEAHPDDLPSNALGALFGEELKNKGKVDLLEEFKKFIAPFKPVPDKISSQLSHKRCVMGLTGKEDFKTERSRYTWFTAEPLNISALINSISSKNDGKEFCGTVKDGKAALAKAGFKLKKYRGKEIIIERH